MGFFEDLQRVRQEPAVRRLAQVRARDRELAEDALQQTYYNVARAASENIRDLPAFFCTALIREIARLRSRLAPIPVEDIDTVPDHQHVPTPPAHDASSHVDDEVCSRLLAQTLLARLEKHHHPLMAAVPGRSPDHQKYRSAIAVASGRILRLLLTGYVAPVDWNVVLKDEYPQFFDEPELARDAKDQRLSRARCDVRSMLKKIVSRTDLAF